MAMIQDTNKVHFTGMTRIELEGNKIIASQNGESKVTISANSHSLVGLADKISETNAKKNIVSDQDMLDRATIEVFRGTCTPCRTIGSRHWCNRGNWQMIEFIEFYLSANRLGYTLRQMREVLIDTFALCPDHPNARLDWEYQDDNSSMTVSYLESKIQKAGEFAKANGFTLPALKNTSHEENITASKLKSLNWAV